MDSKKSSPGYDNNDDDTWSFVSKPNKEENNNNNNNETKVVTKVKTQKNEINKCNKNDSSKNDNNKNDNNNNNDNDDDDDDDDAQRINVINPNNNKPNQATTTSAKVTCHELPPSVNKSLCDLKQRLTNKTIYFEIVSIIKSIYRARSNSTTNLTATPLSSSSSSSPSVVSTMLSSLLFIWDTESECYDSEKISQTLADILCKLHILLKFKVVWISSTNSVTKIYNALEDAKGGILHLRNLFGYFHEIPSFIQRVFKMAKEQNIVLINSEHRTFINQYKHKSNNNNNNNDNYYNYQTMIANQFQVILDFEQYNIEDITTTFEHALQEKGFTVQHNDLLCIVESLYQSKVIRPTYSKK